MTFPITEWHPLRLRMRDDVLHFYCDLNAPIATEKDKKAWRQLLEQLSESQPSDSGAGQLPPAAAVH